MKCLVLFYNRINYLLRERLFNLNPNVTDLNQSAFNFLIFLYQAEDHEMALKQLEIELQQSQSGINEISIQLEKMDLIQRHKDPLDKRRLKARLTEYGLSFAKDRENEFKKEEEFLLSGISENEIQTYLKVAQKIYNNGLYLLNHKDQYEKIINN